MTKDTTTPNQGKWLVLPHHLTQICGSHWPSSKMTSYPILGAQHPQHVPPSIKGEHTWCHTPNTGHADRKATPHYPPPALMLTSANYNWMGCSPAPFHFIPGKMDCKSRCVHTYKHMYIWTYTHSVSSKTVVQYLNYTLEAMVPPVSRHEVECD